MENVPLQSDQAPQSPPVYSQGDELLKKIPVFFVALFTITTVGVFSYFLGTQQNEPNADNTQNLITAETSTQPSPISDTQEKIVPPNTTLIKHSIPEANLAFSAPNDLEVTYEVQRHSETNQPISATLYIQKNMTTGNYYQLYGLIQFDQEGNDLESRKADLEPTTLKETTISGFPALEGQIKGPRNRFVTYIKTDKGLLGLFTAEPTPENKALSDQIINTFVIEK